MSGSRAPPGRGAAGDAAAGAPPGGSAEPLLAAEAAACRDWESRSSRGSNGTSPAHGARRHSGWDAIASPQARIGVVTVAAISFFNVSGGPWGSEDIFSTAGPLAGSLGLVAFTLCFSLPQCLLTAELACTFPVNGGYSVWVREAFGDFWGVQECYWQWVSSIIDEAVYPVLITDTILQFTGYSAAGVREVWLWRVLVSTLLSIPTLVSVSAVPGLLVVFAATTTLPVVAFVVLGALRLRPSAWRQTRGSRQMNVSKFVNVLFWNLEGWDCISTCVTMVDAPKEKTIARGGLVALTVVGLQYLSVLLVAAGISQHTLPWQEWDDGSLPTIGCSLGTWMGGLLLLASVVGNAGQFLSEFFETSYMLQGAAHVGIAPRPFSWTLKRSDTPYVAVLFQLLIVALLVAMDFGDILVFDNAFTAASVAMEFAAFIALRVRQPDRPRPFRVSAPALALFVPALLCILAVLYHCFAHSWRTSLISLAAFSLGVPYGLWVAWRARREQVQGQRSALDRWLDE